MTDKELKKEEEFQKQKEALEKKIESREILMEKQMW